MKKTLLLLLVTLLSLYSNAQQIPDGHWEGKLEIKEGLYIPFRMYSKYNTLFVFNNEEHIKLQNTLTKSDSLVLQFPVFDSEIRVKISKDSQEMHGTWYNYSKGDYKMKLSAKQLPTTYTYKEIPYLYDLSGKWEAWFSPGTENESYMIGVFQQAGGTERITGTFLSETGDYRYLDGKRNIDNSTINYYLSTFDGAHAYYFDFKFVNEDSIVGTYYSGFRWSEPFIMKRNPDATLRDPDELTYLKEGFDKLEFELKDTKGETVSLKDEKYQNMVVIVQIMGSWCPNCMDETRFFNELYSEYNNQGLEIVAIAFERNDNYDDFKRNIAKFTKDLEVHYNFVFGGSTKQSAEILPMLNKIMSYPTAVFIDRKGNVRKIHTGFSGQATGEVYEQQKRKTIHFITKLLEE